VTETTPPLHPLYPSSHISPSATPIHLLCLPSVVVVVPDVREELAGEEDIGTGAGGSLKNNNNN